MNGPLGLLTMAAETPVPLLRRLLVATDGLDAGDRVVAFAIELAKRHGSDLQFCYAIDRAAETAEATTMGGNELLAPLMRTLDEAASHILATATGLAKASGVAATSAALDGHPVHAIVRYASETHASAIVMGTNGLIGLRRFFAGSTADGVLRLASVPVFVVSAGGREIPHSFERILVAADESDAGRAAATFAAALGAADASQVLFCRVVETEGLFVQAARFDLDPEPMADEATAAGRSLLDREMARVATGAATFEPIVVQGDPAAQIVAEAERQGAGLIVMGTHGRRGLQRLRLGSVTEDVVRRSPIPVVVVRR